VYLPDRVLPMLPEKISNELCSLRQDEEKLAFSVLFEFDEKMEIVGYRFAKTVIFSNRRFVYEEVQEILDGADGDFKEELIYMDKVAQHMRAKRVKDGSLQFHSDEVRFKLDQYAKPVEVYVKETIEANLLVEDFMLLANVTVSKYLSKLKVVKGTQQPSVYRVHDKPSIEKLQTLAAIAKRFGIGLKFIEGEDTKSVLERLLMQIENKPELSVLGKLAIRSMAKAVYTTQNIGHYGLGFEYYTHFTSPIRRYPDVLTHRLLASRITKEKYFFEKDELEELLQHCSSMEKKAKQCERAATKYKQVEYLQQFIGEEFEGVISGVIQKGFFVELTANKCEGMVPTYQLDEQFMYDENLMSLKGLRTGKTYQIGEKVTVVIEEANLREKRVEFSIV
jgi:ribonuclease R